MHDLLSGWRDIVKKAAGGRKQEDESSAELMRAWDRDIQSPALGPDRTSSSRETLGLVLTHLVT